MIKGDKTTNQFISLLSEKPFVCFRFLGCKKIYSIFCTENPMDFLVIQNLKPQSYYPILKNMVLDLWTLYRIFHYLLRMKKKQGYFFQALIQILFLLVYSLIFQKEFSLQNLQQ